METPCMLLDVIKNSLAAYKDANPLQIVATASFVRARVSDFLGCEH